MNKTMAKQKIKTKKSAAKRFKITKNGKVLRRASGQSHFNAKQTSKQRRQKRKFIQVSKAEARKIKKLMPYK